jgi:hypothetical protein
MRLPHCYKGLAACVYVCVRVCMCACVFVVHEWQDIVSNV